MSPVLKVAVILNNYLHDVATAMLLSTALVLWLLLRRAKEHGPDETKLLASAFPALNRVAWGALVWIVLGGIPRTVYFQQVEWNMSDPSNKYLFAALVAKHVLMWLAVIAGAILWRRVVTEIEAVPSREPRTSTD